jgi:hypothetical protein
MSQRVQEVAARRQHPWRKAPPRVDELFLMPVSSGQAIAQRGPVCSGVAGVSIGYILLTIGDQRLFADLQRCSASLPNSLDEGSVQEASAGDLSRRSSERKIGC